MTSNTNQHPPFQGIILLRDSLLPDLLKEDQTDILYWAGKELARSYTFTSLEDIISIVKSASFGTLTLLEQKKSSYFFQLHGEVVHSRLSEHPDADFALETGFLAQAIQAYTDTYTEGSFNVVRKKKVVEIILQADRKESVD